MVIWHIPVSHVEVNAIAMVTLTTALYPRLQAVVKAAVAKMMIIMMMRTKNQNTTTALDAIGPVTMIHKRVRVAVACV